MTSAESYSQKLGLLSQMVYSPVFGEPGYNESKEFISFNKTYLNAKESVIKDIGPGDEASKQLDLLTEKAGCDDESSSSIDNMPILLLNCKLSKSYSGCKSYY